MPGPKPNPQARRRNAPTIATTVLPHAGRKGRAPAVPKGYRLGAAGRAWWNWAWKLPQATQWDDGTLYTVARRAQLEDDLAAVGTFDDTSELRDLLAGIDIEAIRRVEWALGTLKRLASGATTLMKEMREIENRLGLNPKALSDLRWTIDEKPAPAARKSSNVAKLDDFRSRVA